MAQLGGIKLTWLGHATLYLELSNGTSILVDPWMEGNPSAPRDFKLPEKIDLLLLTHGHDDHFHDAVKLAQQTQAKVVGMYELVSWMQGKGVKNIAPMNYGGSLETNGVTISMVEARHSSSLMEDGKPVYAGNPCGYVLSLPGAPTVYLAGDTAVFSDMKLYGEFYAPKIGVLPIGDNFTMGPKHAALAAKYLGVTTVVPIHYGTFPMLTGTPEELKRQLEGSGVQVLAPRPGEQVS